MNTPRKSEQTTTNGAAGPATYSAARRRRYQLRAMLVLVIVLSFLPMRGALQARADALHAGTYRAWMHAAPAAQSAAPAARPAAAFPPFPSLPAPSGPLVPGARYPLPAPIVREAGSQSLVLQIQQGWNLISLPLAPSAPISATTVLATLLATTHGRLAALYGLTANAWSPSLILTDGHPVGRDFPLQVGKGYLLYSDLAGPLTLTGALPPPPTWGLFPGWNLVGLPQGATSAVSATTVLSALLTATHGRLTALYGLTNNTWSPSAIDLAGQLVGRDFALSPGAGYLLYSDAGAPAFAVPGFLPPDPTTVAPPVDPTVPTSVYTATQFIYSGPNPIQTGVLSGTIELTRTAILRGQVTDTQGNPLPGATVTVLDHPEYGQTLSRADGRYDLAVNGGGPLTLVYTKDGYLHAQRQVQVPAQDFTTLPTVALLPPDPNVTAINLAAATVQVARGGVVADNDGTRQQTLLFFPGTTATMALPNGSTQPITPTLHVRMTEYTVGASGQAAMPAQLPPTSGYTYAIKTSVDEADAAGATGVAFNQPVISYLENFLDFKVGVDVPFGAYNTAAGQWVAGQDGRVVQILSISNGQAVLDVDGKGQPATQAELAALGITPAELREVATLYTAGESLWRVPIEMVTPTQQAGHTSAPHAASGERVAPTHISPNGPGNDGYGTDDWDEGMWDFNQGDGPPPGSTPPNQPPPHAQPPVSNPDDPPGFQVQNQTVSEDLPIAGTPFHLHYNGLRAQGDRAAQTLAIPLSGASLPPNVQAIDLEVDVAGRQFTQTFPPNPNQEYTFTWDGKDAYGQTLQGPQPATVRIGYVYPAVYLAPSQNPLDTNPNYNAQFGHFTYFGAPASTNPARTTITLWQVWQVTIGAFDAQGEGLGGWSLDVHHTYDPSSHILYLGDGRQQGGVDGDLTARPIIGTVAGNGHVCAGGGCGDGGAATQAALTNPAGVAAAPDGSLYIADEFDNRVRRVAPDGTISTVAGTGRPCLPTATCGDGGPATQAQLDSPDAVAVGPDGSLYIADASDQRIRRVAPDGTIGTVAGTGRICASPTASCGDGYSATQAQLNGPQGIAVGPDGALYIADSGDLRVREVAPDGTITTVAGTGQPCAPTAACGDGGPAEQATLALPAAVAIGPDGSLYIADAGASRIRRVTTDGAIGTFAGTGVPCTIGTSCGDGGPAGQATFFSPRGLAVGPDGGVYIADAGTNRVRLVRPDGTIVTVAGAGQACAASTAGCGDHGIATQATLNSPVSVAVAPDGGIDIVDQVDGRVRRVAPPLPGLGLTDLSVPSQDGSQVYIFDAEGRHLETLDALTAAVHYRFGYDSAGRLISITDRAGNVTAIRRDASGNPTAIVGPFGQTTTLTLDAQGYLASAADPLHLTTSMTYTPDGLLTSLTDPRGQTYHFGYDSLGRLVQDVRPDGGVYALARGDNTSAATSYTVTETSPMSRTSTYGVQMDLTGDLQRTVTDPAGQTSTDTLRANGSTGGSTPDGTTSRGMLGPDPRFGAASPLPVLTQVTTPGGLTSVQTLTRTVSLSDPANVFSMTALTDTVTLNGQTGTSVYTAATRTTTITSPMGRTGSGALDSEGRVAQTSVPGLAPIQYTYDSRGRVSAISQATRAYTFTYDTNGYLAQITDPLGRITTIVHDADGRVTAETLPGNRQVSFSYDANGNLTALTPPGRSAHSFTYTALNQPQSYTPPAVAGANAGINSTYNLDGQVTKTALPDGSAIGIGYDSAGRAASLTTPTGTTGYSYDAGTGNLSSITGPDGGTVSLSYDGSLVTGVSATGVMAGTVGYTYDPNFRVTADSVDGGSNVGYQYDGDGLLTGAGGLSLSYDPHNGLPTGSSLGGITTTVGHDQFGEITSYSARDGSTTLLGEQYTRDALGRVIGQTETIGGATHVYTYSYDAAGHLTGVTEDGHAIAQYAYDANDNRTGAITQAGGTVSASYDAQDRLMQQGTVGYRYTPSGYLQTTTDSSTHQTTTYTYDALGNLTAATLPDGTKIAYLVDGLGRRIEEQVNGTAVQGFLYGADALRPIAELDGSGNLVSRFVYASPTGAPLYMVKGGVTYRILTDDVGSVRLVVNAATGQIAQQMTYDAFGNVIQDTNPGFQPFGFAGGLYDPRTGLVRFGARDYDPRAGRWTAKDPLLFAGGQTNLYAYVGDDPINGQDPTGLGGLPPGTNIQRGAPAISTDGYHGPVPILVGPDGGPTPGTFTVGSPGHGMFVGTTGRAGGVAPGGFNVDANGFLSVPPPAVPRAGTPISDDVNLEGTGIGPGRLVDTQSPR